MLPDWATPNDMSIYGPESKEERVLPGHPDHPSLYPEWLLLSIETWYSPWGDFNGQK